MAPLSLRPAPSFDGKRCFSVSGPAAAGPVSRAEMTERTVAGLEETVVDLEAQVASYRQALDRTISTLRADVGRQQEIIEALSTEVQQYREQAVEADAVISTLEGALEAERNERAALRNEADQLRRLSHDFTQFQRDLEFTREAMRAAQHEVSLMRLSSSWRYTAPLRALLKRCGATTTEKLLQASK
jgi:chromosome segregation ATPase